MMYYFKLISIVFAVSVDGFGVGVTYGMRKIRLTVPALLIIMLCSGTIVTISMTLGHLIRNIVTPSMAGIFGSSILILLGLIVLISNLKAKFNWRFFKEGSFRFLEKITIPLLQPHEADKDKSGIISAGEGVVLGIALAMDAFGAGFGAAILGYPVLITAISVAVMSGAFLFAGTKLGLLLAQSKTMEKLTFLPPLLLIGIGIFNMFQ